MADFTHISHTLEKLLSEIQELKTLTLKRDKPFMSVSEAADYIGIPKQSLYQLSSKKIIPFYKPSGRRIYFKVEDLNNYIMNKSGRYKSNDEIEADAAEYVNGF
ncbi:MAG: helix-turn-helix domain-containing protein [Calditrichaceae bacterium]